MTESKIHQAPVLEPPLLNAREPEIDLLNLAIAVAGRRKFIAWFTIAFALLTTVAVFVWPSSYTATTIILPPQQNSSIGSALLNQVGGSSALASLAGSSLGIKNPNDMYVALFRSRSVEDDLVQKFGLLQRYRKHRMSDARQALENHSTVAADAKDGLIKITVTDHDPKVAAAIANAYVTQYRSLAAKMAISEAAQRRLFFEQQLKDANANLVMAEESMTNTEQKTGVLSPDSQARTLIESAAVLRGQISAQEVALQALSSYATPDNAQVVMARKQLEALKSQLAQLSGTSTDASAEILLPKGSIPKAGMEYLNKLRDVRYYETIVELLSKEFEMAKLDEAREGAPIQVVDAAIPPDKRSFPLRGPTIAIATVLGFLIACGWCILEDGWERLKKNPEEAAKLEKLRRSLP